MQGLAEAIGALRAGWGEAPDPGGLTGPALVGLLDALGVVHRLADAALAEVAARIAEESRSELGAESLAKQQGFRNAVHLIAANTGASTGEAARMVKTGEATAPRMTFSGVAAPAGYPHLAEALRSGRLGMPAVSRIVTMLDRVAIIAGRERVQEGERLLAEQSAGLSLDQVGKLIVRVEAWLDPDGIEPRGEDVRAGRSMTMFEHNGALHINAVLDTVAGAQVKAAIDGYVSAQFQARKDDPDDGDRRTVTQLRADGLTALAEHVVGCERKDVPLGGARVVVRIDLSALESGVGSATIDGIDQPISVGAARRLAAGGGIIPWVCGSEGEILDWGREKRLFTRAQRLALVERDGGCAMCGVSPSMTKAHHLRWWHRDAGRTDLADGVLLCESCHHRIHDNGWKIRVEGVGVRAKVWFIPPPHVDPDRVPRLGGRARYDLAV